MTPESTSGSSATTTRWRVVGMDCAHDAAAIERAARTEAGTIEVHCSVASQELTLAAGAAALDLAAVERAVAGAGFRLERLDGDDAPPSHRTAAYRRAIWLVVLLNAGYGVVEMIGGLLARSQALQADALDFLGDGGLTLLGVLAIGWRPVWRARAALAQGVFLGALGLGVLATTLYRVVAQRQPDAGMMGAFSVIALLVNVAAALLLVPHRAGDANVRAVWLFSRNDAIGNAAVLVAAALVAWTSTPWPDLVVAGLVALLFLHSAWVIVRDASRELAP